MAKQFQPLSIAVLTISDSRIEATDRSGKLLVERLEAAGHHLYEKAICPDDIYEVRARVARWVADDAPDVVITTGGTGLTGRDTTPAAIKPLLDRDIPGFGEIFRMLSYDKIKTSTIQSRAFSGLSKATVIFCLPGSASACADGWEQIISQQIDLRTQPCNLVELLPRFLEK